MNAGLMTTTVMAAVVVFLAGSLLIEGHPPRPEPALVLLATSALGFILATLMYANTYARLVKPAPAEFHAQIHRANVVSECFGVYCLILAVPLTIVSASPNQALRWFVATVTFATIVGYQFSGASLLQQYLAELEGKWSRLAVVLLGGGFTVLLLCLGGWAFAADLVSAHARLVPVFVLVLFLAVVALLAMSAQPKLHSEPPVMPQPISPPAPTVVTGPRPPSGAALATNAPPGTAARRRSASPGSGLLSWLLVALTLLLLVATLVFVVLTLQDQRSADARATRAVSRDFAAVLSSIAGMQGQALAQQRQAEVATGELTGKVYSNRVHEAVVGLLAALRTRRELPPAIPLSDLNVSVPDGVAMLRTKVDDNVLTDLSNFFGQMRITYGNFRLGRRHRKLSHRDHIRVCRTIAFANKVEADFRGVPKVGLRPRLKQPAECH
jgi:type II secretory pathway pseudopilin PulG